MYEVVFEYEDGTALVFKGIIQIKYQVLDGFCTVKGEEIAKNLSPSTEKCTCSPKTLLVPSQKMVSEPLESRVYNHATSTCQHTWG